MKKILELLYYGQINEAERPTEPECIETSTPDEEDNTYDAFYASLSKEQKALFEQWEELYALRLENRIDDKFARGFKMGFHLAVEILDFKLP